MIHLISDIIVALSAATVAVIAFVGIQGWRKELAGRAKFEIARNIMLLCFKLEDNFGWAQSPFTQAYESADRKRKENESTAETHVLDEWSARWARLKPLIENLQKLQEFGWEADILLPENSSQKIDEAIKLFRKCYVELSVAIQSYFSTTQEQIQKGIDYENQDWLLEQHKLIYGIDSQISLDIVKAKELLVNTLKAYVK